MLTPGTATQSMHATSADQDQPALFVVFSCKLDLYNFCADGQKNI
jgi:hypothetical protein